jgi:hypothetical protein
LGALSFRAPSELISPIVMLRPRRADFNADWLNRIAVVG